MFADKKEVLVKLGMALYIRKHMIKKAERARDAVQYLAEKGALPDKLVKSAK